MPGGLAAFGQLPHGHLGLLVRDVDVDFERLLVDVADPAAEREEVHTGKDGDRAEGMTAPAIGNIGKRREAVTGGHGNDGHATEGCCDAHQKLRSHDTSRIAWAKLMARVGEGFPVECPTRGGDIRLIALKLFYQCETIRGRRTVGNRRLLRTSCPRSGADPEDPHAFG